jgi:hypothetical protein
MRNRQCLCGFARVAYRALAAPDCQKSAIPVRIAQTAYNFPRRQRCRRWSIRAENKGQSRPKHLNSFSRSAKDAPHFPNSLQPDAGPVIFQAHSPDGVNGTVLPQRLSRSRVNENSSVSQM